MGKSCLESAIQILAESFANRDWKYLEEPADIREKKVYCWPGNPEEEIMICVHKGQDIHELFHRQDFFFFNFAYQGDYGAISYQHDNYITVRQGECYIGQPFTGYALYGHSEEEIIIMGILIQKETFFKTFLPVLSSNAKLFHFFLDPQNNPFSDEFIHLKFEEDCSIRCLFELMVIEYANKREDTQHILRPLVLTLFMYVARQYNDSCTAPVCHCLSDRIVQYMAAHSDVVTLKDIAAHFSYHPNYISSLLRRELGKTFSEILLEQRMEKGATLLKETCLPIEEIALMLGYRNSSNFYKAFREYYGQSPREYIQEKSL